MRKKTGKVYTDWCVGVAEMGDHAMIKLRDCVGCESDKVTKRASV